MLNDGYSYKPRAIEEELDSRKVSVLLNRNVTFCLAESPFVVTSFEKKDLKLMFLMIGVC